MANVNPEEQGRLTKAAVEEASLVEWLKFQREVAQGELPTTEAEVRDVFVGAFFAGAGWGADHLYRQR